MNKLLLALMFVVPLNAMNKNEQKTLEEQKQESDFWKQRRKEYLWDRVIAAHEYGKEAPELDELMAAVKANKDESCLKACSNVDLNNKPTSSTVEQKKVMPNLFTWFSKFFKK